MRYRFASTVFFLVACGPKPAADITPDPVTHPNVIANDDGDTSAVVVPKRPLAMHELVGPFTTVEQFCDTTPDRECEPYGPAVKSVSVPYHDAVVLMAGAYGSRECILGLLLDSGWFFRSETEGCGYSDNRSSVDMTQATIRSEALLARGQQVVFEYGIDEVYSNLDNDGRHYEGHTTGLVVCGVGPSGRPSCSDDLTVGITWTDEPLDGPPGGPTSTSGAWSLDVEYVGDAIVVTRGAGATAEAADRIGQHVLVFP